MLGGHTTISPPRACNRYSFIKIPNLSNLFRSLVLITVSINGINTDLRED